MQRKDAAGNVYCTGRKEINLQGEQADQKAAHPCITFRLIDLFSGFDGNCARKWSAQRSVEPTVVNNKQRILHEREEEGGNYQNVEIERLIQKIILIGKL